MLEPGGYPSSYPRPAPHGLMFHHLHGEDHPEVQGSISQAEFEAILAFVGPERILPPDEWLSRLERGSLRDTDLCLTFDDGLLCQVEVALPVLERLGLRAFWFVYSGVFHGRLEKLEIYRVFRTRCFERLSDFYEAMFARVLRSPYGFRAKEVMQGEEACVLARRYPFYSSDDIRFRLVRDRVLGQDAYEQVMDEMLEERGIRHTDLAQRLWMADEHLEHLAALGHHVGLHSYSHPLRFGDLPLDRQRQEYAENHRHIVEVCGRAPRAVSHPVNSYGAPTLRILADLEIRCGFRSDMHPPALDGRLNPHPLELAREDHANILRTIGQDRVRHAVAPAPVSHHGGER